MTVRLLRRLSRDRYVIWAYLFVAVVGFAFYLALAAVAVHFILKYW